jgi:hypothetical protein
MFNLALSQLSFTAQPDFREGELVTVGGREKTASFTAIDANGHFIFRNADGNELKVPTNQLVRWSNPPWPRTGNELHLADGTRLTLSASWSTAAALQLEANQASVRTTAFGSLALKRSAIKAAFWRLPFDAVARHTTIDELVKAQDAIQEADLLALDNGDRLIGQLQTIAEAETAANKREAIVAFNSTVGEVKVPLTRVRGLVLARQNSDEHELAAQKKLLVGLRDGSLITANSLTVKGDQTIIASLSAGELKTSPPSIAALQSFNENIVYLSDLQPGAYNVEPYLDLHWPYRRDRNVLNRPLIVGGEHYPKGIGMHSQARLTYNVDKTFSRFAAQIALDDAAKGEGSVIFRALLHEGGQWREAYASPTVHGGDPPRPIAVDLAAADQLALEVTYADQGDEHDDADWLDARLERTANAAKP